MATVRHARGTRAALNALASSGLLVPWQLYVLSDENRVAIATSASTYQAFAKESEGTVGGITKSMVGLGNVDNTSDANKPVSTAQAAAIATATAIHPFLLIGA